MFSAKLSELCGVSVNADPAKAQCAVSDSVKRFGDYTPKDSVFSFSVTPLNKYTIAKVRSSADPSVKLTPVRIENGAYFYEWTVTGIAANVYKLVDKKLVYLCCVKIASDGSAVIPDADSSAEYIVMVCEFSDEPGDINNDGILNALDAAALLKHIVGISEGTNMLFTDFNHDGSVNALDSSAILKSIVSR